MTRAQIVRGHTQPLRGTRGEVLHEDVRAADQAREDVTGIGSFEVECERFFRSVQPHEVARKSVHRGVVAPCEIAAVWTLDLDHPRAEIGELPGGKWRRYCLFDRDHGNAIQRPHGCPQYDRGNPSTCSAT